MQKRGRGEKEKKRKIKGETTLLVFFPSRFDSLQQLMPPRFQVYYYICPCSLIMWCSNIFYIFFSFRPLIQVEGVLDSLWYNRSAILRCRWAIPCLQDTMTSQSQEMLLAPLMLAISIYIQTTTYVWTNAGLIRETAKLYIYISTSITYKTSVLKTCSKDEPDRLQKIKRLGYLLYMVN